MESSLQPCYSIENPNVVSNNLGQILYSEEFSDVTIIAGGEGGSPSERIPAHRQILAASSETFKAMLYSNFVEG